MNPALLALVALFSTVVASNSPDADTPKHGMVSLTFDDGFASQYRVALPILDKAKMKGTFYIVTRLLDLNDYMTADNVKALHAAGHEIGSHTCNHVHLPAMSPDKQEEEIRGSLEDLAVLGISPTSFAYPYGERNDDTRVALSRVGLTSARTIDYTLSGEDPYQLQGYALSNRTTVEQVKVAIDEARRHNTWLVLIFHRIDEGEDKEISVSHETLQQIVDYLSQTETQVVTVQEGMYNKSQQKFTLTRR